MRGADRQFADPVTGDAIGTICIETHPGCRRVAQQNGSLPGFGPLFCFHEIGEDVIDAREVTFPL